MKKRIAILLSLTTILCTQVVLYTSSTIKFDNHVLNSEKIKSTISYTDNEKIKEAESSNDSLEESVSKTENKESNKTTKVESKPVEKPSNSIKKETPSKPSNNTISKEESNKVIGKQEETKKLTEIETIAASKDKLGTIGRLYLPSVNLNVAVYEANAYRGEEYNAQKIVDAKDSAAHFYLGGKEIIADHNYQGFKKIMNLKIGDKAYVKKADGTIDIYQIKENFIGKNTGTDIVNSEGISIVDMKQDLIMYTCYTNDGDITITRWDKVLE